LVRGAAEVFGTEMARNQSYSLFPRQKLAIFTWHGCTVRVEGDPQVVYISEETPMIMYLNTHIAVDQLRHRREKEGQIGPRVSPPNTHTHKATIAMLLFYFFFPRAAPNPAPSHLPQVMLAGATDVGKSSLCRLLLSYAARLGRQPCLVDCDVGQGSVSIPGSLCEWEPDPDTTNCAPRVAHRCPSCRETGRHRDGRVQQTSLSGVLLRSYHSVRQFQTLHDCCH
jgi:polyribonucleotide 5'-hydroxyl-kinase